MFQLQLTITLGFLRVVFFPSVLCLQNRRIKGDHLNTKSRNCISKLRLSSIQSTNFPSNKAMKLPKILLSLSNNYEKLSIKIIYCTDPQCQRILSEESKSSK